VVGTGDYPGCMLAALVAERLGLPSPSPEQVVLFSHKFYSREIQKRVLGDSATPDFEPIDPFGPRTRRRPRRLVFPFFVKPVKGTMSIRARMVHDPGELERALTFSPRELLEKLVLLRPYEQLLTAYSDGRVPAHHFVAEAPLGGVQVTVDGFVQDGRATVMGIVDSVMYPGTRSFQRFELPSRLPPRVQARMIQLAIALVEGSGFDQACFNIEMFHDPASDRVAIIEINPRMSYQFADLYQRTCGLSTFAVQMRLATGEPAGWHPGRGADQVAASFVLRRFSDARVLAVPGAAEVARVMERFPGTVVKVLCTPGQRLSELDQDVGSFRYGIVNLGASTWEELHTRWAEAERMLPFVFA
jgi:biotin carboxylase